MLEKHLPWMLLLSINPRPSPNTYTPGNKMVIISLKEYLEQHREQTNERGNEQQTNL